MATSGSVDFSRTRSEIITHALQVCKVLAEGETANSTQLSDGAAYLNMVVKWLQADGMPLWSLKTAYLLPVTDTNTLATNSHWVHSFTQSNLAADASSGASTISVDSATGFAASQVIGIELSDGTMHWTTINGALSGTTVTLTTALTGAASDDAQVYTYATSVRAYRPLRVTHAMSHDVVAGNDIRVEVIAHRDYADIGDKTAESYPNQLHYDPQLETGGFYFYPRFSNGDKYLTVEYHRPFEDFDSATDTPDFPQEWYLPLVWLLAWALSPWSGMPLAERKMLREEAVALKDMAASGTSNEEQSIRLTPSER